MNEEIVVKAIEEPETTVQGNSLWNEDKLSFLRKVQSFRTDLTKCDWSDNKMCNLKTGSFAYISSDKIKAQMNPVFIKNGLHWKINYRDAKLLTPVDTTPVRWLVTLETELTDVDTGYTESYVTFGEGSDYGDKGLAKACTYALKTWLSDLGMIANGIDPDAVSGTSSATFVPRSPSEEVKVQSKISASPSVVKPPMVAPKSPKTDVVKSPAKPAEHKEAVKSEPSKGAVSDSSKAQGGAPITTMQSKTIDGIVAKWTKAGEEGKVDAETYNRMSADKLDVKTSADAARFITKYMMVPEGSE